MSAAIPLGETLACESASNAVRAPRAAAAGARPLVVDLDGTLIRSDLLLESFFHLLAVHPLAALGAIMALRNGKAALKSRLADLAPIDAATLPFNESVLDLIKAARAEGRPVYLVSAADDRYVRSIADHLGLFDAALGSREGLNLAGTAKAERLCALFGEGEFDYVGDAPIDELVWRRAGGVYVVGASARRMAGIRTWAPRAVAVDVPLHPWRDHVRSLRLHQWLKNILIFVPALAAHQFGLSLLFSLLAFVSFSLCASSVYLLNDLLDLKSDRAHERKRLRPFAAGRVPLAHGAAMVPILLIAAFGIAAALPPAFALALLGYFALTCAYSFYLKRKPLIDVVTLACLYGARLVAGAAAASVALSPWLIAFSTFIFLSLALVKRCSELADRKVAGKGEPVGRGYRLDDLPLLQTMAVASGYVAVLVLSLYINSDDVRLLYARPTGLWLLCVLLLYWISRVALLTHRGQMHDDPVVFAARDWVSRAVAVLGGAVVIASI